MTDYSELKRLAEKATNARWHEDDLGDALEFAPLDGEDQAFILAASPASVFELVAEIERLSGECEGCPMSIAEDLRTELDQLKAENEALRGAMLAVSIVIDGDIRVTVRDCVNGLPDVQDIYGYCDNMDAIILAALSQGDKSGG